METVTFAAGGERPLAVLAVGSGAVVKSEPFGVAASADALVEVVVAGAAVLLPVEDPAADPPAVPATAELLPGSVADSSVPVVPAVCTAVVSVAAGALTDATEPVPDVVLDVVADPVAVVSADEFAATTTAGLAEPLPAGDDAIAPTAAAAVASSAAGAALPAAAATGAASAELCDDGCARMTVTVGLDAAKIDPNAIVTVAPSPLRTSASCVVEDVTVNASAVNVSAAIVPLGDEASVTVTVPAR